MTAAVNVVPISLDYADAATFTGHSVDVIRRAVRSGELTAHYPTSKPVVLTDDLRAWVLRAPTERKSA